MVILVTMLMLPSIMLGQGFTNLHRFSPLNSLFINSDGAYPTAGLVLGSNTLFGTTSQGGMAAGGTLFKINTDGTGFKVLYSFTPPNPNTGVTGDGAYPLGPLTMGGSNLYGTTSAGGISDNGIIFKINLDGSGFATLHAFSASDPNIFANSDGAAPWSGLVLAGTTLYGTASRGGDAGSGTVFKLNTDGMGFTRLHSFSALDPTTQANSDGAFPLGGLVLSGNTLFGTTYRGGSLATGTVFKVNVDGTGFLVLHNSDGGPRATLVLSNNVLYGTSEAGGTFGGGTVFGLNTDGRGFTNVQNFAGPAGDGPWGGVILSGRTLQGTTFAGGDSGQGSVFEVNIDGAGFTNLYSFAGGADGAQPQAGLLAVGDSVYGTASAGGSSGSGTLFKLSPGAPGQQQQRLMIVLSGSNAILTWPTNSVGLMLQSTTSLAPPITWTLVPPGPVVVNGQNAVTNPVSSTQRFYRLSP